MPQLISRVPRPTIIAFFTGFLAAIAVCFIVLHASVIRTNEDDQRRHDNLALNKRMWAPSRSRPSIQRDRSITTKISQNIDNSETDNFLPSEQTKDSVSEQDKDLVSEQAKNSVSQQAKNSVSEQANDPSSDHMRTPSSDHMLSPISDQTQDPISDLTHMSRSRTVSSTNVVNHDSNTKNSETVLQASYLYATPPNGIFQTIEKIDLETSSKHAWPTVLILTPVKDAKSHLDRYFNHLYQLSYPHDRISIGMLDSDSTDISSTTGISGTFERLTQELPKLQSEFRRVILHQHDFGFSLNRKTRHAKGQQLMRRSILARARNYLLSVALYDEEWVFWIDSDLDDWGTDVLQTLINAKKPVIVPNCVMGHGQRSYDLNSWASPYMNKQSLRGPRKILEEPNNPYMNKESLRGPRKILEEPNNLTMKQSNGKENVSPMLHKARHLTAPPGDFSVPFPNFPLPRPKGSLNWMWTVDQLKSFSNSLELQGYGPNDKLSLSNLRDRGNIVQLGGVGGAMLLVYADAHREGLIFPPFPYENRIETEGLAQMAWDMGYGVYGMPNAEIIHT